MYFSYEKRDNVKPIIAILSLLLLIITGCNNNNATNNLTFELNELEKSIYEQRGNFNEEMLLNLDPISVAKLYIYASYNGESDFVYHLYTQRDGYVLWTKEEDKQIPIADRGSKEQLANTYRNIENGTFYRQSEYEGYIEYETGIETETVIKSGFKLIKNSEQDIWKVSFMPSQ